MDLTKLNKQQQKELFIKESAKRDLLAFSVVMDKEFTINWHHKIIASRLEQVLEDTLNNKPTRLMLCLPPRHGKSYLTSQLFPAWCLGKNPSLEFVIASYSADLAQDFGFKTRDLLSSEQYQYLFNTKLRQDSKSKAKWNTVANGSFTSVGVGGALTGKGGNILIVDDPFKGREDAESETMQKKIYDWYRSVLYTRQQGNSAIIIINTRWSLNDLSGKLLEQQTKDEKADKKHYDRWEVINFPAIAEDDEKHRSKGEALWPGKFPIKTLETIKNSLGTYDWNALYQQRPIAAETQEFKRQWFKYYDPDDISKKFLNYKTTVDLAISEKDYADETVILTVGKDISSPNWYIVEYTKGKFNPGETIDMIFYHQKKYNSDIYIETVAYQRSLKYFIEEQQKLRETYFMVNELKSNNKNSKQLRIRGLIPMYERGIVYHRNTQQDLEDQLLLFPQNVHDDIIDALASQVEAWQENNTVVGGYGIINNNKPFDRYDIF